MGHARLGRADAAKQQIDLLHDLRAAVAAQSAYWARQIDIQTLVVEAWLEYATVGVDTGLATMREAVELEAATEKDPVTPGEVLPAIELLGEMLLESGAAEAALIAYEQSLARAPLRLNSLYGAGLAAQRSGRFDAAKTYFGLVVDSLGTDSDRSEMAAAAAAFVAGG